MRCNMTSSCNSNTMICNTTPEITASNGLRQQVLNNDAITDDMSTAAPLHFHYNLS
jgi:hypothetical protein